jgi:protein involved in polysaccharide export with SLBB domain
MGGVNKPAVFELKGGETVSDLIKMAGNFSPGSSINSIHRMAITERAQGFGVVKPDQIVSAKLSDGDIVKVSDTSQIMVSNDRMMKRVIVQGQVNRPGEYFLPANATLNQAIDAAGGKSSGAFIFGLKLTRKSVLEEQRVLLRRILRELDREIVSQAAMRPNSREEAEALTAKLELGRTMLARLQSFEPEGRIALPVAPGSRELPSVRLEDGDVITVPATPNSVGVFGSVVSAGTFLYDPGKTVKDYLALAGGVSRGADKGQIFVIEANGQSRKDDASFISWGNNLLSAGLNPGDAIVVPENMDKTTFTRELVQITQILYQLGLGAAGIKILRD